MAEPFAAVPDVDARDERVRALVADPVAEQRTNAWQVGHASAPTAPNPAATRAARLEARLTVYAQYAAVVADEADAVVAGDEERRTALRAARGAAAEHFAELREAGESLAVDTATGTAFSDALTDALHELRHQEAVDGVLARRLRALNDTAARDFLPALAAGSVVGPRIDVRF